MSRHETKGTDPAHYIIVGWDPPLATYFGQVHVRPLHDDPDRSPDDDDDPDDRSPDPDDNPVCWVGASLPQLKTVDALEAAMQPYLKISPELRTALEDDKAHDR